MFKFQLKPSSHNADKNPKEYSMTLVTVLIELRSISENEKRGTNILLKLSDNHINKENNVQKKIY